MSFEKEKYPSTKPSREPERRYEAHPAVPGPIWTEEEIKEEKRRRQEDPNWFREQE